MTAQLLDDGVTVGYVECEAAENLDVIVIQDTREYVASVFVRDQKSIKMFHRQNAKWIGMNEVEKP